MMKLLAMIGLVCFNLNFINKNRGKIVSQIASQPNIFKYCFGKVQVVSKNTFPSNMSNAIYYFNYILIFKAENRKLVKFCKKKKNYSSIFYNLWILL